MRARTVLALHALLLGACRVTQFDGPVPSPGGPAEASGIPADEGSAPPAAAPLPGSPRPDIVSSAQRCEADTECRVLQPSDWSADVECCYEYGCGLDFVAVNTATLHAQRAWQAANPFDCTSHLREHGPCETRVPRCGLDQSAPPAVCRAGTCAVAWPEPWPRVDPEAQTCSIDADCRAFRPSSNGFPARCCGDDCGEDWTAVSAPTAEEITRWRGEQAGSCEDARAGGATCPPAAAAACTPAAPAVRCVAGICQVGDR